MHRIDDAGKIFVGGLSYETTKEGLEMYFSKYGAVADCVIMKAKDPSDPTVERSRGFGFVTYGDPTCVQKVLDSRPHYLDNKEIDPKPAVPRAPGQMVAGAMMKSGGRGIKCFIGGVAQGTTEEDIKVFFSTFGPVTDVTLMKDPKTNRMRGFGFVGFHSEDAVQKICAIRFHQINGKTVEAKRAEPRDSRTPSVINSSNLVSVGVAGASRSVQQQVQQQQHAPSYMNAGYGMGSYGQTTYGYNTQAVSGQPGAYGVPASSSSAYGNYGSSSYAERAPAQLGPESGAGYTGYTQSMGMYGAIGGPSSSARYEYTSAGQGGPVVSSPNSMLARGEAPDYAGYGSYGLGSYPQEASQYGPTRGGLSEGGFASSGAAPGGGSGSAYGAEQGGYPGNMYESMGRGGGGGGGGGNSNRGYHPYGR